MQRANAGSVGIFVFAPTAEGAYARMFAFEHGIVEDPATGSATGPLAAYMMRYGLCAKADGTRFVSEQGTAMGRRSRLHVHIRGESGSRGSMSAGASSPSRAVSSPLRTAEGDSLSSPSVRAWPSGEMPGELVSPQRPDGLGRGSRSHEETCNSRFRYREKIVSTVGTCAAPRKSDSRRFVGSPRREEDPHDHDDITADA